MYNVDYTHKESQTGIDNSILNGPQVGDWPPGPRIGDIPGYPYQGWGQQGWICPKCGRVNAPHADHCPCSEPGNTNIRTGTESKPYWDYLSKSYSTKVDPEEAKEWFDKYVKEVKQSSVDNLTEEQKQELMKKFTCSADVEKAFPYNDLVYRPQTGSIEETLKTKSIPCNN